MGGAIQAGYEVAKGILGGVASSKPVRSAEHEAGVALNRGSLVKVDATGKITALTAVTDTIDGVLIREDALSSATLAIGEIGKIAKSGDIWVNSDTDVVKGQPVFARCLAGAGTVGDVTTTVDGVNAVKINAVFTESAVAGLVQITPNLI